MITTLIVLTIISIVITSLLFKHNRYNSLNSALFTLSGLFIIVLIVSIIFTYNLTYLYIIVAIISILIIIPLTFGVYFLVAFFFLNAYKVFKEETRSFSNSLTLIMGILGVIYLIATFLIANSDNNILNLGWQLVTFVIVVYLIHFYLFILNIFLVNVFKPKQKPDFIIVLGSGLVEGKVTPLLASRINKGIEVSNKYQVPIVFSGGQGSDEPLAEGLAMKNYALKNNEQLIEVLVEDKSRNTWENFKYSQTIIEKHSNLENIKIDFVTSNYHVFRAGWYAHKANINALGIGSKTAFYFLPNAIIREFVAMILLQKKYYIIMSVVLITFSLLIFLLNLMNN